MNTTNIILCLAMASFIDHPWGRFLWGAAALLLAALTAYQAWLRNRATEYLLEAVRRKEFGMDEPDPHP